MGIYLKPRNKIDVEVSIQDYRKLLRGEEVEIQVTMPDGTVVYHAIAKRNAVRKTDGVMCISIELPGYSYIKNRVPR
jgi:hypothetical protein